MKIYRCLTSHNQQQVYVTDLDLTTKHGRLLTGSLAAGFQATEEMVAIQEILPPLVPSTVIGIGLNYRKHAAELNLPLPTWPVVFAKLLGAVTAHNQPIRIPQGKLKVEKADYEAELAVVIGKRCLNVSPEQALEYVAGYMCANDVSARDWQLERSGGQWSRGKSFDTFLPLGPCLVTPASLPDPQNLGIRTRINGETLQDSHTHDMIFSVAEIISFLSTDTTLEPGTVIITGTPEGVGASRQPPRFLRPGDVVEVEIEGIGVLRNRVE